MNGQINNPLALVTGASSGIGRDIAVCLSKMGYDVIITGRNEKRLNDTKALLDGKAHVIAADLSDRNTCFELYKAANEIGNIDVLINNAGFGLFGEFSKSDLTTELNMIDANITALHIQRIYLKCCVLGRLYAGSAYVNVLFYQGICSEAHSGDFTRA